MKDPKVLLQELREGTSDLQQNRLTEYEMKEMIARGGMLHHSNQGFENGGAAEAQTEKLDLADKVGGVGFEQRLKGNSTLLELQKKKKGAHQEGDLNKIEGEGVGEDLRYMDQRKKLVMINYLKEKIEQQKAEKKQAKLEKKLKKREKKKQKKE